jgi:hypothetical protein
MQKAIRLALATAILLGMAATASAQSVMKQCGEQWLAAKAAGTTNGETWPQFLAQCQAQLSSGAATAPIHAETLSYRFIASGPTLVLNQWTCWFRADCKYAPCHMTTVQKPILGRLKPSVVPGVIPPAGGLCAGKPVPMLNMTYTPSRGAHGLDQMVLESHSENGSSHTIYIYVQVP